MKKTYSHKEMRRLKVDEIVDFLVIKTIILPNNIEYFILQDPFGERHLLPASYYKNYEIVKGKYLKCHVDKINCKGQIFLEPIHPHYQVGKFYEFKYLKTEKTSNRKGVLIINYIMLGRIGQISYLAEDKHINRPAKETWKMYKIIRIKKAKIFLSLLH